MIRRVLYVALIGALAVAGIAVAHPASAAPSGTLCQLDGTANFSPGLGAVPGQYTYSFTGTLSGCQSNVAGAPTGGTIAAQSNAFQTGGCVFSTNGSGVATVTWGVGDTSSISYTTQAAGAGVIVQGVVTAGRYAGNSVDGLLVFQTTTPQDCAADTGLTSSAFTGETAVGTAS